MLCDYRLYGKVHSEDPGVPLFQQRPAAMTDAEYFETADGDLRGRPEAAVVECVRAPMYGCRNSTGTARPLSDSVTKVLALLFDCVFAAALVRAKWASDL